MPLPPGPTSLPVAWQTARWVREPVAVMEGAYAAYGPIFTLRLAALGDMVVIADPDAVRTVFKAGADVVLGGEGNRMLEVVLGSRSLMTLDGDAHLRDRRLLLPPFHGERLGAWERVIREVTADVLAGLPTGRPVELHGAMKDLTMLVVLRTVFGVDAGAQQDRLRDVLRRMLDEMHRGIVSLPAFRRDWGWTPWSRFLALRDEADELVLGEIAARRSDPDLDEREDVLSLLLLARDEDGRPLEDRHIRDELVSLLVAGHETSGAALAWAAERLTREPGHVERLREEGEEGPLTYADAVVKEVLRLRPPVPVVRRRLAKPLTVGAWDLPEGTVVAPCAHLVHRLPALYPEPDAFRPERWLDRGAPEASSWFPFGGGMRRCIGASFAMLELRIVVAMLATRLDLAATDEPGEGVVRHGVTLAPSDGGRVTVAAHRAPALAA
jgi:cytochrome P450